MVSSANSVSNHSVAVRPFTLNPLRLPILRKPVSISSKQRCAVLPANVKHLAASRTLKGILPLFEFDPVLPGQFDVKRSAIRVERLPRDRVEHVLLQRDIAAFGALSLVIWAAIGQWATMRLVDFCAGGL